MNLNELRARLLAYWFLFVTNQRAEAISAGEIVLLAVGFLLVAVLTPIGMTQVVGANTTGWEASVKTIFTVLFPLLYIVGVAIRYVPGRKK